MKERVKRFLSVFICVTMVFTTLSFTPYASESSSMKNGFWSNFSKVFALAKSSSVFTTLEIREGSLNGDVVADLLSSDDNWSLKPETDYYIYGSFMKTVGNDYLQIRFGNDDKTFNGVTFFDSPGGTYIPGAIEHDYLDELTAFTEYDDPTYGNANKEKLVLQDGEMIYHIKDQAEENSSVNFAMGMVINDAVFSGIDTLENAISVAIGSYDGDTKVFTNAVDTNSEVISNLKMADKGEMQSYFNNTALSAVLDEPGDVIQMYIGDENENNPTALLYDELEFDISYPTGAILDGVSFSSSDMNTMTSSTYGTLTVGEPTISGDITTTHVIISNGYRSKDSSLSIYYCLKFPSTDFTDGESYETKVSNTTMTAKDTIKYGVNDTTSAVTYTILDISKDYTISYDYEGYSSVTKGWLDSGLLPQTTPTKTGAIFAGWYYGTIRVLDDTTISDLIPADDTDKLTLTAVWTEDTYTIIYDSDGDTYYFPKTNVAYSAAGLLPDVAPTRTGYTFDGWYSADDTKVTASTICSGLVNDNIDANENKTITLTAEWTVKTGYTVKYNSDGGTSVVDKTGVNWTDSGLLPDENPTREGYDFDSWICGIITVTKETAYNTLASTDVTGSSITLIAQWKNHSYTVLYDTGGGTAISAKTVSWASTGLLPTQSVSKDGYKFTGWVVTDGDGNSIPVTAETAYSLLAKQDSVTSITLTAQYEEQKEETDYVTDLNTETGTDVQGRVVEDAESPVYKLDISWGEMKFEFHTDKQWNPDKHILEYQGQGTWNPDSFNGINNQIKVENHSNENLFVDFDVIRESIIETADNRSNDSSSTGSDDTDNSNTTGIDVLDGVNIKVLQENKADGSTAAPSISAYLWLDGESSNISQLPSNIYTKIGTITVTCRLAGGELTPKSGAK